MMEPLSLAPLDYVIIACVLAVSLGMGVWIAFRGRNERTREYYLVGNRRLHVFPVMLSLFVTFMSSTSLIGIPPITYMTGSAFFMFTIGMTLSFIVGVFTVIPVMHPLKVTSIYEYFKLRFQSPVLHMFVTAVGMCLTILFTAVVLVSPAVSIQTAAGLPFWVSVVIVGAVGIIYTSIGGIRGVVIVDVFQAAVIVVGILSVLIKGVNDIGGLEVTWSIAKDGNRIQRVVFDPDPRNGQSFWAFVAAMFTFFAYTFDQSAVQRICSVPTMAGAQIVYAGNIFLEGIYVCCLCFMGIVAYSYFVTEGCDPFKSGILTNKNQLMPYFVMKLFKDLPGMAGLYLATIFSGALSTVSSVINGLAANTIEDILKFPLTKCKATEGCKLLVAKLAVCFFGFLCIGLAFLMKDFKGTVIQTVIALLGALGGPVAGVFFLGASVPWANKIGATTGLLISLTLTGWLSVGAVLYGQRPVQLPPAPGNSCAVYVVSNITDMTTTNKPTNITTRLSDVGHPDKTVFDISYHYYGLIGWMITFIVGLLVSLLSYKWCKPIHDERLYFPLVRKLLKARSAYTVTTTDDEKNMKLQMAYMETSGDEKNTKLQMAYMETSGDADL